MEGFEISSIERLLRDTSLVSVIVIDDVEEDMFHSDISIEMRRVENDEVNYTTHQLRVNKSVFQMTAYGWHQYKKRDYGIEVYPSSHLLLHQKRYLPQSIINTKMESWTETICNIWISAKIVMKRSSMWIMIKEE